MDKIDTDKAEKTVKKILIVEDEDDLQMAYSQMLSLFSLRENLELEVSYAGDGHSAQDLLLNQNFDLVMLDMGIPGIPGQTILEGIRASNRNKNVPVIILSGDISHKKRELETERTVFLPKPFSVKAISKYINLSFTSEPFTKSEIEAA